MSLAVLGWLRWLLSPPAGGFNNLWLCDALGKQDLVQGPDFANGVKLEVNAHKLALCVLQPPCPVPRPLGSLSAWRGRWGPPRDDHRCEHRHQNQGGVVAMGAGVLQPEPPKAAACRGAAS